MLWKWDVKTQPNMDHSDSSELSALGSVEKENSDQNSEESKKKCVSIDARASNIYKFYD